MGPMEYRFGDCVLDDAGHALTRDGRPVQVEPMVFDLLRLLLRHPGELVSRDRMIDEVWKGRIVSDSAITACVASARRAVGDDGKAQTVIRTVARRGLQMVAEVETDALSGAAAPVTVDASAPPDAHLAPPRLRFAKNAAGRALAYAITGEGPHVLHIGPAMATDVEAEWHCPPQRALIDALSSRTALLRYDQLGSGRSDRSVASFDFEDHADDLRAVADAAGWNRFALFSESGGVHTALRFAARHPDRVSRLAIIGGYVNGRSRRLKDGPRDAIRAMVEEGWRTDAGGFLTAFLLAYMPEGPLDAVRDVAKLMKSALPPENVLGIRDAINEVSNADILPAIQCPTLILHARDDGVHPLSEAQALTAGIARAELLVLETANHIPFPGNAAYPVFVAALQNFLAS